MVLPAAGSVALGWAAYQTASGVWGAYVAPYFEPATARNRYVAWTNDPCLVPEPSQLMSAWSKGFINSDVLPSWIRSYGIRLADNWATSTHTAGMNPYESVWTRICQSMETPIPPDIAVRKYHLADLPVNEVTRQLRLAGYGQPAARAQILDQRQVPNPSELIALLARGKITAGAFNLYMRANGVTNDQEIDLYRSLQYQIPGPSDLVNFAVREVWDIPVVNRFGYDLEFPAQLQTWMDRQGMGWKPSEAGYPVPAGQDITWPQAYWRAHWNIMSPGQAGEALYRLRPRAPGDAMSRIPGVPAFTAADYDTMMRIADYPPLLRQWFSGLATNVLPIRRIQSLFDNGIVTLDEVKETFKDQAYSDSDAEKLKKLVYATWYKSNTAKARLQLARTARKGFSEGWMDENGAAVALYRSMLINPEQVTVFEAMSQADKETTALDNPAVKLEIASLRVQAVETIAAMTIRAVQQSALRREVTEVQARQLLATAGIKPDSINEYIRQWNLQLMARGRNATAAQVLKWFQRGSITTGEASVRLAAAGYNSADIRLMLGTAAQDQAMSQQKTAEQLAKTQQAKLRAQQQQLKLADANRRRIMADLSRSASRTGILTFLKDSLISKAEAKKALMDRGILDRDADLWIADALKGKANGKATKTSSQAAGQATSNGTVPGSTSPG